MLTAFSLNIGSAHFGLCRRRQHVQFAERCASDRRPRRTAGSSLLGTTDDFTLSLTFNPLTGSRSSGAFNFTTASTISFFQSSSVSSAAAVPEPATWAMMLLGFGGIGFAMRRGRKQNRRLLQIA